MGYKFGGPRRCCRWRSLWWRVGYKFGGGGGVGGPVAGWADAERAALSSPERPPPRVTPDELLSIADDVVARARPDEELEAVVS